MVTCEVLTVGAGLKFSRDRQACLTTTKLKNENPAGISHPDRVFCLRTADLEIESGSKSWPCWEK